MAIPRPRRAGQTGGANHGSSVMAYRFMSSKQRSSSGKTKGNGCCLLLIAMLSVLIVAGSTIAKIIS